MTSHALHSLVTRDGYVSQAPAPHVSVPSDHAMLQQFAEFLELRLQTECMGLLRRVFADFLLEHEHTLLTFLELAANIIVVKPFDEPSARRRRKAAALLDMPKRPLHERGCVFFYLAHRVHTRNMGLLKMMFAEFLSHGESLIQTFVARGDAVISVIPCALATTVMPFARSPPPARPVVVSPTAQAAPSAPSSAHEAPERRGLPTETADAQPTKSPAPPSVLSPRSPTNSDIASRQSAATVVPPSNNSPSRPVLHIDTTIAQATSDDSTRAVQQQQHRQQEPLRPTTSPQEPEHSTTQQERPQQPEPAGLGLHPQLLESMAMPARPSGGPQRRRVGRPKYAPPAKRKQVAIAPVPSLGAKASASDVKTEVLELKAEAATAQPVKRKPGRPRKIKSDNDGQGADPSTQHQPAAGKKKRRKRAEVAVITLREPSKRQKRQPESFLEEQAIDALTPKRKPRSAGSDASDVVVKSDSESTKWDPMDGGAEANGFARGNLTA